MEHYVCIDGIEVSNPLRTRDYLVAMVPDRLAGGPARLIDCGCGTPDCLFTYTVGIGFILAESDPVNFEWVLNVGRDIDGDPGGFSVPETLTWARRTFELPGPCGGPRPPCPDPDDVGWSAWSPLVPFVQPHTEDYPYGVVDGCRYIEFAFVDAETGYSFTLAIYRDLGTVTPSSYGTNATANDLLQAGEPDGGTTWNVAGLASIPRGTDVAMPCLPFTDPLSDDAPWFDPSVVESADVIGVWLNDLVLSTPFKREVRDKTWGTSLGRVRWVGREMLLSGVIFTKNVAATEYARQWLFEALQGGCGAGPCGLPDATIYKTCEDSSKRTLRRIGLVGWQWTQDADDFPSCWGGKFEATLRAESPFLYHDAVTAYDGPLVPGEQEPFCNVCGNCPPLPSSDPLVCGCMDVPSRVVPVPAGDDCFCLPVTANRLVTAVAPATYWTDATAIIKITAGFLGAQGTDPGLRNVRIRAWPNPLGYSALADADKFECIPACMEIDVACVPRGAILTIDGTTRRATLEGFQQTVNARPYLSSNAGRSAFSWPEVACDGLYVMVDTDATPGHTASDSTLEILVVGQDRG